MIKAPLMYLLCTHVICYYFVELGQYLIKIVQILKFAQLIVDSDSAGNLHRVLY